MQIFCKLVDGLQLKRSNIQKWHIPFTHTGTCHFQKSDWLLWGLYRGTFVDTSCFTLKIRLWFHDERHSFKASTCERNMYVNLQRDSSARKLCSYADIQLCSTPGTYHTAKMTHILKCVAWRNPEALKYVVQLPESMWATCCQIY